MSTAPSASSAWPPGTVEVRVPADGAFIATLRLATAALAARCDLTVDEIEDLRLAVDEACALLLGQTDPGTSLDAEFRMSPGQLTVIVAVPGRADARIDRTGFGWTVVGALASTVAVSHEDGRLAITVTKRRGDASR